MTKILSGVSFMKKRICILLMLLALLLTACSLGQEELPTVAPAVPTVPTEPPMADLGGMQVSLDVVALELEGKVFDPDKLIAAAVELDELVRIDLGLTELSPEKISELKRAYPNAEITFSLTFLGQPVTEETVTLDAATMSVEQTDELLNLIGVLPALSEINFVTEEGNCVYGLEDIAQLDRVRMALPDAYLRVCFDLFGQKVTSEDERIEYYCVEIGNEGAQTVRSVLPYLESCTYFLLDGCGIDDEIVAQMRDDFPETEIVWRIWLIPANYKSPKVMRHGSYLTDTHRIRTTLVRDNNAHLLNYCTKTIYMDIGHIDCLTDCSFISYMPDLEVCILAITGITDISPLANHDKLEYLELFTTDISDLSPLASCPNLEHLNISNMPYLEDLTPIFGLTNLKRLRIVRNPLITKAQIEEVEQMLPNCEHLHRGEWPTSGGWRWIYSNNKKEKVERYALLCEQMEYTIDATVYGID